MSVAEPFIYQSGRVEPGETRNLRHAVTETYLGDPVQLPVTVVNGEHPGPTVFLSAAAHGDELNGVEVVRAVAQGWTHADLHGTLVCLPVLNVPAFIAQQRYLPIHDRDLNRSFPGRPDSTGAKRMAHSIFRNFVEPCDLGLDFHTSTRGRTNMLHVRADTTSDATARLASAFGSNVVIDKQGPSGSLRREATTAGVPTVAVEMGEAHRFQRRLIDEALLGVESTLAEFGLDETSPVRRPDWRTVVSGASERTWMRADAGGLVETHADCGDLVREGDPLATITNPFKTSATTVDAPFTGLLIGVLENPLVYPGNPLCHLVHIDERTWRAMEQNGAAS
jgi:predicted deacylase